MLNLYIDSLLNLSTVFYGIPLLVLSALTTVVLGFVVFYPLGKMMNTNAYKSFPVFHIMPVNNYAFKLIVGFPVSMVVFLTLGITILSFVNVLIKIFM